MSLTKEDTLIFWRGTNDIIRNNSARGIKKIHICMTDNQHTNITRVNVPVRYDLNELPIINEETWTFNRKLDRISSTSTQTS